MKSLTKVFLVIAVLLFSEAGQSDSTVYICDSKASVAFHLDRECRGLARCKHDILTVSKTDAIKKYGRRLCGYED